MKRFWKIILYGFLLWLTVFVLSFLIFPVKQVNPPFFETLITIVLTVSTVFYGYYYFRNEETSLKKCLLVGFAWVIVNLGIDLPLFLLDSPMKMTFMNYMTDIGLTYLIIPVIILVFSFHKK